MMFESKFLSVMQSRGFVYQCTDETGLDQLMQKPPVTAYIGFDCTGPSLHVGSLIQIMALRWLQKTGHKPIVLMGGGTTQIGDPSGKEESRRLLTKEVIATNKASIQKNFERFITFGSGPTDAIMVDNADWLDGLQYIPFLRDIGRHFSINDMLRFESVKQRLEREQPLSFLEFNYMLLQAYDFVWLYESEYRCRLQIGGSDQWGNILSGINLQHGIVHARVNYARVADYKENFQLFGLTTPLITTSSGAKMGKTAKGAVWLNPDMLSPYEYWQFWRNTEDADVGRFLRLFTELSLDEIERLEKLEGAEINEAKKVLANEATKLCHGEQAAREAAETAHRTFEQGTSGEALPHITVPKSELEAGIQAYLLFHRTGLAESGGAARKLIRGNGARINDKPVASETDPITLAYLNENGEIKLSAGKKHHLIVRVE